MTELLIPVGHGSLRTSGRSRKQLHAEKLRDLTEADLAGLGAEGRPAAKPAALVTIRERHHKMARLLAAGLKPGDVAASVGVSLNRISILQNDPQFKELVEHYRGNEDTFHADLRDRMQTMSIEALEELSQRLEDKPDSFTEALLLEISTRFADRVGHSPKGNGAAGNTEIHLHIGERMAKARERLQAAKSPVIDATPNE